MSLIKDNCQRANTRDKINEKQVLPNNLGRAHCHPYGREWIRPMCVLAVQCPL